MTYQFPPEDKELEYRKRAYNFLKYNNPANMFVDCASTTYISVIEFLANEDGYTLYPSAVDAPLENENNHPWANRYNP